MKHYFKYTLPVTSSGYKRLLNFDRFRFFLKIEVDGFKIISYSDKYLKYEVTSQFIRKIKLKKLLNQNDLSYQDKDLIFLLDNSKYDSKELASWSLKLWSELEPEWKDPNTYKYYKSFQKHQNKLINTKLKKF